MRIICRSLLTSTVPAIVQNPLSITGLITGQNATFNCTAYGGLFLDSAVSLIFTWSGPLHINFSNVMNKEHADFSVTSILTLENITIDFVGNYRCSVAYSDLPYIMSTSEAATLTTICKTSYGDISTYMMDGGLCQIDCDSAYYKL